MSHEPPLMVIGHRNPDTDSICSAIAYAHYKREIAGVSAIPFRAGNLNPQTSFVLAHFGVAEPRLLTTLFPKISDIMIHGGDLVVLSEQDTLGTAVEIITTRRFAFLPVTDEDGKYAGQITAVRLAGLSLDIAELGNRSSVSIRTREFVDSIAGEISTGQLPENFEGRVWLRSMAGAPPADDRPLLAVVSGGEAEIEEAIHSGAGIIVVCATDALDQSAAKLLAGSTVCVVTTKSHPLEVATRICLAMPLEHFVERQHPVFKPHDLVREVRKEIRKSNEGGFIIVDDDDFIAGVITRLSFLSQWRFRVALVDHNELSQAVDGVEEADVEEIIDHHRLGYRSTEQPITFINKVVGCTCTIIAELYRNARCEPPREIAGLMLAAILSDTVILRSPTTTPLDHDIAGWLAGLAGEDLQSFGSKMFAAGCAVEGADPATIVRQDLKVYEESGWKLSVSQMETVGFDAFRQISGALTEELAAARSEAQCDFSCLMVTDITSSTSLLLCCGEQKIMDAITYPRLAGNLFEMSGVLSRKKQMMPYLAALLRNL